MSEKNRFRLIVRAIAAWLCVVSAAAFADAPAAVPWPPGWDVQAGPAPTTRAGRTLPGSNEVAMKRGASGAPEAALALMRLVRIDHGAARLDDEFGTMLHVIVDGYRQRGWTAQCAAAVQAPLGGRPGLATTCDMRREGATAIRQAIVATMTETTVYELSFTAPVDRFDAYRPAFDTMRARLTVQ
ncbi:hypothetical protein GQ56_0125705 [Burkholderia paludis]|uniref:DUF4946 domain-containing protein n=1 Tax=Burkholderia paludis TaxID=1506587 RepID=UPI0004DB4FAE|nr:DUF4946 domain-containing protein [Burkholderia paludis]KFG94509.1 hypothetical protein GQ56_0125705 [Burkholderia paludis]